MALTENEKKSDKKEKPLTKVIIRRLPPAIDQETFLNQVSPVPDYNYIYVVKGDSSLGEHAFSRVYINFVNPEDIYNFKERFDNYVFLDNKGHEYPAVVEFASFQKIPKKRGKARVDPKCGSIETDPIYVDFVESLNKPQEQDEKPEYTLQLSSENKNEITTPLLEFIKNKRAQRMRIREIRREERKRREFDRRKDRYDDRRKVNDENSPAKGVVIKSQSSKTSIPKEGESSTEIKIDDKGEKLDKSYEKSLPYYKNKERRFEDRKYDDRRKDIKPRHPRKEYIDNRDYKEKEYKPKYDEYKKDVETKSFTKKVKKYSEKREERKMEAQKAEQKRIEHEAKETKLEKDEAKATEDKQNTFDDTIKTSIDNPRTNNESGASKIKPEKEIKSREGELQSLRRIRNKDRPTIAIYRPGMLSKRKQNDSELSENKEGKSEGKI